MLLRAQRDGIRIVWATGRDLPHFATVREALHTDIFAQNFYIALNGALIVNCGIGAEQRTDGFAADNVDPFLQIADAYDLEALSYTRNGCFRYAQPGFEQLRLEYLKEHSLAIKDNVEHLFGGNIELPTPCYPSAAGTVQKVAYLHSSLHLQQLLPDKECRTADRKGGGEASFKLLRPPQREGTNLRKFLPPLDKAPDSLYTMHHEQRSRWGDPMNLNATSKANILKTSRELIQQNGWAGVNIRSVAAACGVSVGCIYNYFASKTELLSATVESIWSDIFHHPEDKVVFQDTLSCVRWMYQQLEDGCQRYPGFFTHHALGFVRQDTADGKQQMQRAWRHILEALCVVLQNDTKIRADAFTEEFTVEKFAETLFSLMLSALVRQDFDPSTVLEIVRRAIY